MHNSTQLFFLSHIGFVFNDVCLCVSKCHSVCACLVTSMLLHVSIFMYFGVLFFFFIDLPNLNDICTPNSNVIDCSNTIILLKMNPTCIQSYS